MLQQVMRLRRRTATKCWAPLAAGLLSMSCASQSVSEVPRSHAERVVEDVEAMIAGMNAAHQTRGLIGQAPGGLSVEPRSAR